MYDRTSLRAAAGAIGDKRYLDLAERLKVAPATAWRLWSGKTAPSSHVAAKIEAAYGLPASRLLVLAATAPAAA